MLNKKFAIIVLAFALLPVGDALAYDDNSTHPALTDEIVDYYNLSGGGISQEEKEWIVEGSRLEDTPPRWINHFYDPVRKIGWTGDKAGNIPKSAVEFLSRIGLSTEKPLSAVEWVDNYAIQDEYGYYGGNRTWKRGLEYYTDGDKKQAYMTLGHILHVLEDMSVPDHTRDDTHAAPLERATGDPGSPYELWAEKWNRASIKSLEIANSLKTSGVTATRKLTLAEYISAVAEYSNKYFFSRDTINDPKYQFPKIVREDDGLGYGIDDEQKEFPVIRITARKPNTKITKTNYVLDQNDDQILSAYFSRLSRKAVIEGAGVVALFEKAAGDALVNKEYPNRLVVVDPKFRNLFTIPNFSLFGLISKLGNVGGMVNGFSQKVFNTVSSVFAPNDSGSVIAVQNSIPYIPPVVPAGNPAPPNSAPTARESAAGDRYAVAGEPSGTDEPAVPVQEQSIAIQNTNATLSADKKIVLEETVSQDLQTNQTQQPAIIITPPAAVAVPVSDPVSTQAPVSAPVFFGGGGGGLSPAPVSVPVAVVLPTPITAAIPTSTPTSTPISTSTIFDTGNATSSNAQNTSNSAHSTSTSKLPDQNSSTTVSVATSTAPLPQVKNFSAVFSINDLAINFLWNQVSLPTSTTSTVTYFIANADSSSSTPVATATSASAGIPVPGYNRDYNFSIRAASDRGKDISQISTTTVHVPDLLFEPQSSRGVQSRPSWYSDNWYKLGTGFYGLARAFIFEGRVACVNQQHDGGSSLTLEEFLDVDYFRLNKTFVLSENAPFILDATSTVAIKNMNVPFQPNKYYKLNTNQKWQNCGVVLSGSSATGTAMWDEFVSGTGIVRHEYPFYPFLQIIMEKNSPPQSAPSPPPNLKFQFDALNYKVNMTWASSTDADTTDNLISYETNYSTSTLLNDSGWAQAQGKSVSKDVVFPNSYAFGVRAKDDFGNISIPATSSWKFPDGFAPLPSQMEHSKNLGGGRQMITIIATTTINGLAMWTAPEGGSYNNSQTFIEIYTDKGGVLGNSLATSSPVTLSQWNGEAEAMYAFPGNVLLASGTYWIIINGGPETRTNGTRFFGSSGDAYAQGKWVNGDGSDTGIDAYFRLRAVVP